MPETLKLPPEATQLNPAVDPGFVNDPYMVDGHVDVANSYQTDAEAVKQSQYAAERTYDASPADYLEYRDALVIHPAEYDARMDDNEVANRFEVEHVVKVAPRLSELLQDTSLTDEVTYVANRDRGLRSGTSASGNDGLPRNSISEASGLQALDTFLQSVIAANPISPDAQQIARSMRENITYIDTKRFREATEGIAAYWKTMLDSNPNLQLCVVAGKIAEGGKYSANDGSDQVKSDMYMLDSVLQHFSDDELRSFKGRLITDVTKLKNDSLDTRVILLDDWAISGTQLSGVANELITQHPELEGVIEVQVIAATAARIKYGTLQAPGEDKYESRASMLPVRAYYLAHDADPDIFTQSGAHITGSHCAADYDYEDELGYMTKELFVNRHIPRMIMPPLTSIDRIYRHVPLTNIARLNSMAAKNDGQEEVAA